MAGEKKPFRVPLNGKWVPAADALLLDDQNSQGNFSDLSNMRYVPNSIRSTSGHTKINTSALATYTTIRSGHHFKKDFPAQESQVLVQAFNAAGTASKLFENTTAIPNQGNFNATAVHTDASGAGIAKMSDTPLNGLVYCNGVETLISGGLEMKVGKYLDLDPAGTYKYDYTEEINSSLTDEYATIHNVTGTTKIYIGTDIPPNRIKWYVKTANGVAGTTAIGIWDGTSYASVSSLVDGTAVGGVPLAQTGVMTFDDTSSVAKQRELNSTFGYWLEVTFTNVAATTLVYQVTLGTEFVPISDIWDGIPRKIVAAFLWDTANFNDYTTNCFVDDYYTSAPASTYMELGVGFGTTKYLLFGFTERMTALIFHIAVTNPNKSVTNMLIDTWDGSAWANVGTVNDGTKLAAMTLAQNGMVSWNPPDETTEFKKNVTNENLFYYYKVSFDGGGPSGGCWIDAVYGVPAPKKMRGFAFPVPWQDRICLGCETSKNVDMLRISSSGTRQVFNGTDSVDLYFEGKKIVIGGAVYDRFSSTLTDAMIVLTQDDAWMVDGTAPPYRKYQINNAAGCPSPGTFQVCDIGLEISPGVYRHVAIWHTGTGMAMFDQNSVMDISGDIRNYWEEWRPEYINKAMIPYFSSFYDERYKEYHLLIATGTSTVLDKELVFDLLKRKWYPAKRTTAQLLTCGFQVSDTLGNRYVLGGSDRGIIYRLEDGPMFDTVPITSSFKTSTKALAGFMQYGTVRKIKLVAVSKPSSDNEVTVKYYGDTALAETAGNRVGTISLKDATHRLAVGERGSKQSVLDGNYGKSIFSEFECIVVSNDEDVAFEPVLLGGIVEIDSQEV